MSGVCLECGKKLTLNEELFCEGCVAKMENDFRIQNEDDFELEDNIFYSLFK